MLNSVPVRFLGYGLNRLMRFILLVSTVVGVLVAFTIIALRYWLLPDIERYHDRITASLAVAIGNPVTIGRIQGDWEGLRPHLNFSDVRILDGQRQIALALERIDGSVSWMSLFSAELRLANLEINKPELLIRRDEQGRFFIGSVLLSQQGDNHNLADWLLHQSGIVVRDALIVWVDEQRNAPPLVLQNVNLRIDNLFGQHRFALRAIPPAELAAPLDVRGEFYRGSFNSRDTWYGQLFTQLDYTDVSAWRPWLDLPSEFSRGRGALRGWLGINNGKVVQLTADLDLRDVATQLGADLPEMELRELRGRAAWQAISGGYEISTRHLAMRLQNGIEFPPTDFYFRNVTSIHKKSLPGLAVPAQVAVMNGELRANLLQLENLASLAKFLPLDANLQTRLDAYAPRGKVTNLAAEWQGAAGQQIHYKLKGHFENLALNQVGTLPGFSGLTLDVDGNETTGKISINSHHLAVDAPGVMREPLLFATLTGQGGWHREGELVLTVDNVIVSNDDLAGNLYGSYHTPGSAPGALDLTVNLTRADIRHTARYTPLVALNREGNDWLNGALLAGHSEDFHLHIKGSLNARPGDTAQCGALPGCETGSSQSSTAVASGVISNKPTAPAGNLLLEISGHARDAVLEFDKHWPRIQNISGELSIRGNRLEVKSPSATLLDTRLQNVSVTLPDMLGKNLSLEIKGEAVAASNSFLKVIQNSPLHGYINGFTDGISASGNAHLDLSARIPLTGDKKVQIAGTVKVQDNDIDLGQGVPLLRNTRGTLAFSESGMQASGVSAQILGGTASINVQTAAGGALHAAVKGRTNIDALRRIEPHPLFNYLHGSASWDADINVVNKLPQVIINSDLQGISSSLPQPFSKRASDVTMLHLEMNPVPVATGQSTQTCTDKTVAGIPAAGAQPCAQNTAAKGQDEISAQLGKLLSVRLLRREENGAMAVKRGVINFGSNDASPKKITRLRKAGFRQGTTPAELKTGVWITGTLPVLSVQGWEALAEAGNTEKPGLSLPIAGINLDIEKLSGYGQSISALHIDAVKRGDGLAAQLSSSTLDGEVIWEPRGYQTGSLFRAHLNNLQWAGSKKEVPPAEAAKTTPTDNAPHTALHNPGNLPALEIAVENLQLKGKQIGHFELVGHPADKEWRLRRLNINNPDGNLVGEGVWGDKAGQMQTQLNLTLNIRDAGKMLGRFGYPNTVKGGVGKLTANLSWTGNPDEFSYATLNGNLKLDSGKGRFLKMDQTAGKLLSILSLQDLPKHIALGFADVFSEGFQFDNIIGEAAIRNGVMDTQEFHIYGSAAKVALKGSVDLNQETQNLSVKVFPAVGDSMSLLAVFAINPAAGIAGLIADKLLGNPLDKLVSFEYNISGTWNDPQVIKVGRSQKK